MKLQALLSRSLGCPLNLCASDAAKLKGQISGTTLHLRNCTLDLAASSALASRSGPRPLHQDGGLQDANEKTTRQRTRTKGTKLIDTVKVNVNASVKSAPTRPAPTLVSAWLLPRRLLSGVGINILNSVRDA